MRLNINILVTVGLWEKHFWEFCYPFKFTHCSVKFYINYMLWAYHAASKWAEALREFPVCLELKQVPRKNYVSPYTLLWPQDYQTNHISRNNTMLHLTKMRMWGLIIEAIVQYTNLIGILFRIFYVWCWNIKLVIIDKL